MRKSKASKIERSLNELLSVVTTCLKRSNTLQPAYKYINKKKENKTIRMLYSNALLGVLVFTKESKNGTLHICEVATLWCVSINIRNEVIIIVVVAVGISGSAITVIKPCN